MLWKVIPVYLPLICILPSCQPKNSFEFLNNKAGISSLNSIKAVNEEDIEKGTKNIAIIGATLIDGRGGPPVAESCVLIRGNQIISAGKKEAVEIPEGAELVDAEGLYLLPGLIDAHFHLDEIKKLPHDFLVNGITSLRDPGEWIEYYEEERASDYPLPRLFLTGPHLDMPPSAHPKHSVLVRDEVEAIKQVYKMAEQGASAIKVYYRLSLGIINKICEVAHSLGLPVTAHLEISDAREVVLAGVDGIEHVTSLGLSLLPGPAAEQYRQSVLADNNARRDGRYKIWNSLDLNTPQVDSLVYFLKDQGTFLCPTLAAFEYHLGEGKSDSVSANGYQKMQEFVGKANQAGVRIVVGSHSIVPYASKGWAYHQEMELLADSGMSPGEIIVAATMENARFFRIDHRLGSVEKGKIADLLLVKENPLDNIKALRSIHSVMLNGVWVNSDN